MLYISTVFVRVHFAYRQGVPLPTAYSAPSSYGQLFTERVRGVLRLELWPLEFSPNTKATTSLQPRCLWRPELTVVGDFGIAFTGMEKDGARWVLQRWLCDPQGYADLVKDRDERQRVRLAPAPPESQSA